MAVSCKMDFDCPKGQYCYDSSTCVDFTQCIALNREENTVPARDVFQCGPCLEGFYATYLDDGSEHFCKKISTPEIDPEFNLDTTIWCISLAVILLICLIYICIFVKKQRTCSIISLSKRYDSEIGEQNVEFYQENSHHLKPTAPSEGHDVYNQSIEKKEVYCQPFHNNGRALDNNKSQNAVPFQAPGWVRNSNISETNNNNAQYSAQRNRISHDINRLSAARNDPETNEQLSILMPERTVECEDNARNTAVMRINDNDDTNSAPSNDDENDNRSGENGTKIKTVVIVQNINVNMAN